MQYGGGDVCGVCHQKVYLNERFSVRDRPFHRRCMKCSTCKVMLKTENYFFNGEQFFCKMHYNDSITKQVQIKRSTSILKLNITPPSSTTTSTTTAIQNHPPIVTTSTSTNNKIHQNNNYTSTNYSTSKSTTPAVQQQKKQQQQQQQTTNGHNDKSTLQVSRDPNAKLDKHYSVHQIEQAKEIRDHYIFGRELGRGGFSIVLEAVSKKDGIKYAIKIVDKLKLLADIKREVEIMFKLSHPNVLKLHEIFKDKEKVYIVMELVQGSELFDRIVQRGYYTEKHAINIVKQVLEAVAYLHLQGVAHRDLKPENLLCSGAGDQEVVKIADFGLSKIFQDNEPLMTSCGTPSYVAPEVLMCESYDKAVDLWGVGIVTYILLAGYPPFYGKDDTVIFDKIAKVEYNFNDETWNSVSDLAKDFIKHLLTRNPKERFTAEQALQHPWILSFTGASEKPLNIARQMSEFNIKRKENKPKPREDRDSIGRLNQIAQSMVNSNSNGQ